MHRLKNDGAVRQKNHPHPQCPILWISLGQLRQGAWRLGWRHALKKWADRPWTTETLIRPEEVETTITSKLLSSRAKTRDPVRTAALCKNLQQAGEDGIHQVCSRFRHAPRGARGSDAPAFAGEGHQKVAPAVVAAGARKDF
jgi:hypothetical protein